MRSINTSAALALFGKKNPMTTLYDLPPNCTITDNILPKIQPKPTSPQPMLRSIKQPITLEA